MSVNLRQKEPDVHCHCVSSREELHTALMDKDWEVVLCDYRVPEMDFKETLCLFQKERPDVPLILISGSIGEEKAVELLKLGAWDFVLKDGLARLWPAIERGMKDAAARRARQMTEKALAASEQRYRTLFEGATEGILAADGETGAFLYANPASCRILGYEKEELLRMHVPDILPKESLAGWMNTFEIHVRGENTRAAAVPFLRKDGTGGSMDINTAPVEMDGRRCVVGFFTDVTEQMRLEAKNKALEAQLLQAQKLEAVGKLAGGVAHDYNNMLAIILGYGELALSNVDCADPLHYQIEQILSAAERSRDITRQLLAFARRDMICPKILDLNDTLEGMSKMLRRLVGEDIQLTWLPGGGLWTVMMDPSQLDQILANLCVNARDAIPDTGRIIIETKNVVLDDAYCAAHAGCEPGEYVMLSTTDDGCGMGRDILDKIFEPFFTTKGPGKGTGLGLSTVYGIVNRNEGYIDVSSEPGKGTTFTIYLPRHASAGSHEKKEHATKIPKGRGETVLVVEDEADILELLVSILQGLGYAVIAAGSPGEALALAEEFGDKIHLLITDVIMPEMNGKDLADRIQTFSPNIKRLFMSGYTADVVADRVALQEDAQFIQKPFSLSTLAIKLREAMKTFPPTE